MRAVPVFKVLRIFRLIRVNRLLGRRALTASGGPSSETARTARCSFCCSWASSSSSSAASAILAIEQYAPGANITTASDALWFTMVTISTVGYGDKYPVTNAGTARRHGDHHRGRGNLRHVHRLPREPLPRPSQVGCRGPRRGPSPAVRASQARHRTAPALHRRRRPADSSRLERDDAADLCPARAAVSVGRRETSARAAIPAARGARGSTTCARREAGARNGPGRTEASLVA